MPSAASFTVADILDRGITAVPDVLTALPEGTLATHADVDGIVKAAFSNAAVHDFDLTVLDPIITAGDPLARATAVIGAKYAELGAAGGLLGPTSGAVAACADGFGYYRHFRHGSIFWHPAAGAHEVHGPIRAKWAALGWERSVVGYPTSDQLPGSDADQRGAYNTFQGGAIHWYPPGFGGLLTGVEVGALDAAAGAIAAPKSRPRGAVGIAAATATRDAQITVLGEAAGGSTTATGAFALGAASRAVALDAAGLEIGQLLGRLDEIGGGTSVVVPGEQATVLGSSAGAFEVHGEIGVHYRALGGSGSVLGYPTTDETGTPDGVGRFNHFQAGSIYWTPGTGAHEVHGLIRAFWAAAGWERNSALGYPISDELIPDRRIGHRFPERKKKALGLPPDVVKLPADAVVSGFSPRVANLPIGEVVMADTRSTAASRAVHAARGRRIADAVTISASPAVVALPAASGRLKDFVAGPIDKARIDVGVLMPQPSSTPASEASVNRFGDFENGVVFWRRGASAARQLQPWVSSADGSTMRRTPTEVAAAFDGLVRPALAGLDGAAYESLTFFGTTAYTWDGATVHNRAHRFGAMLVAQQVVGGVFGAAVTVPTTISIELRLETTFDPDRRAVVVYLAGWSYTDSMSLTASPPLLRQLHPRLDGLLYRRVDLIDIPDTDGGDPIAVLSAKTLSDGSAVVYIEPDDPLVVSGAFVNIHDALGVGPVIGR